MLPTFDQALVKRRVTALIAAASWLWLTTVVSGGEKIRITEGPEQVDLPAKVLKDDLFSKPLDFLKSRSSDGAGSLIPSLPPPNRLTNTRKDQLERKNWIKNEPETLDQDAALKQIFGVREYDFESLEKRPKGSFEDLLGGSSARKYQSHSGRSSEDRLSRKEIEKSRRDLPTDPISRFKERDQTGRSDSASAIDDDSVAGNAAISELNLNNLFNPSQAIDPLSRVSASVIRMPTGPNGLGQVFNQTTVGQAVRTREQELRWQQFEKLVKGPPSLVKSASDPINSLPDGTRQEINPIKGRRLDDFSGSAVSVINSDSLPGLGRTSRPGLFDSLNSKVLGASSLAPSIVAPSPSPIFDAKPLILEIPRRKF